MTEHQLSLSESFNRAFEVMSSSEFLNMEGLNNEVPYFVLSYRTEEEPKVEAEHIRLVQRLRTAGTTVADIDLYSLCVNLWQEAGIWEQMLEAEPALPKDVFAGPARNIASPEAHLSPRIADVVAGMVPNPQVVLLSGVGRLYPLVRAHTILNTLQPLLSDLPVVLVFPGSYRQSATQGSSLVLFDRLTDDDYYRAFDLIPQEAPGAH
ncbi:DUF1788 domain-containing protein [Rhodococcus erythropolis]|uniref:DUF1788 domain-containing protein n=1 Tax=Rhodococcus erythropolis TaxID=1833 RepID=UPI001BE6523C|nr:DUF1788 domain-containing protein [Rhodococcus erythropolis]MBT2268267.1 DUF1788 domain-containing protein [Rhodococcus erythropolis]